MSVPRILTEFRELITSGLAEALAGGSLLYPVLRYHVGLEDANGARAEKLGKLLRPSLVLFTAGELGAEARDALPAAVGLELIHNFSLIHDDIQDGDRLRRGRPTVWAIHGTAQGINAGDLMETIAIRTALRAGPAAADALLSATIEMIEGQALDLAFEGNEVGVAEYTEMVDRKTGALIRCAFALGGIVAAAAPDVMDELNGLGTALGRAFQFRDDILAIWGNSDLTGKPLGSDIRRRKNSLPIVLGLAGAGRDAIGRIYRKGGMTDADVATVVGVLEQAGARDEAERLIEREIARAREALGRLPFSPGGRRELSELIDYLARRER